MSESGPAEHDTEARSISTWRNRWGRLSAVVRQWWRAFVGQVHPWRRAFAAWMRRLPLAASVGWAILGLFLVAWVALWVMYRMGDKGPHGWDAVNPLNIGAEFMTWSTRLKYAAAVATGAGAVVALVVNYRKQRDAEDGKFTARFADASAQLGSEAPAVRIAGVYALAALADEQADRARRQLCIDALCGYLRLPYDPQAGSAHTSTRTVERPIGDGGKTTTTDTYRPADREVWLCQVDLAPP